jgi:methylenetetrahydrofolate reductase (NADPH)
MAWLQAVRSPAESGMNTIERLHHHLPLFSEARGDIEVSFEFFPPKSEIMAETLWTSIQTLAPLQPRFVSVTYGAGGSTRERTHQTVERILKETELTPAAHLTCVGASRNEVNEIAREYWDLGVRNIVALRGDPSEAGTKYQPHTDGYRDAAELVSGLKSVAQFDISVAAYPEIHPDSSSRAFDLDNLRRKVDAGADRAITQFFFSSDCFFRFRDDAAAAGIDIEIVPGILPVSNVATTRRFALTCGANIPQWLDDLFEGLDDLPSARQLIAATVAAELCGQLYAGGVRHFHFYTLNRAELSYAICHLLGVRAKV